MKAKRIGPILCEIRPQTKSIYTAPLLPRPDLKSVQNLNLSLNIRTRPTYFKSKYCISANSFCFLNFGIFTKLHLVSAIIFLLCNQNLNNCRTRLRKLFKGGNYSKEETICGNTVCKFIVAAHKLQ